MKKTMFVLALLLPFVAMAAVKLDVKTRWGGNVIEQVFELTPETKDFLSHYSNGVRLAISLVNEEDTAAQLGIKVISEENGERVLSESQMKAIYRKPLTLKCPAVDTEVTIIATPVHTAIPGPGE